MLTLTTAALITITALLGLLRAAFRAIFSHLQENAGIYIWHAHLQYPVIASVFEEFHLLCHQPIIWKKPSSTFTYGPW